MSIAMKAPGRYVQGFGERKKLGQSVKKLGSTFYVLCSPGGRRRFGEEIEQSLTEQEKTVVFAEFHGEATKAEVFAHMDACKAAGCDAVIGMGGGKVIDTAKTVAENLGGLPCIIIPTVASNDAPCSAFSLLEFRFRLFHPDGSGNAWFLAQSRQTAAIPQSGWVPP